MAQILQFLPDPLPHSFAIENVSLTFQLLPLVIQSLSIVETSLLQSTLSTITDLIEHSSEIILSHIDDILPRLLTLSQYKQSMVIILA